MEDLALTELLSRAVFIHTGISFLNTRLFGGLLISLLLFLAGLFLLSPISLDRRNGRQAVEDTDQEKLDKARAIGGLLIVLSLLLFIVSWNLLA